MSLFVRDEGTGPAVLLVHGFPLGGWMWDAQVEALKARYRVLVPDLRGFGGSAAALPPLPPDGAAPAITIDDHADDLAATLASKGVERAAVVGFSMGGYVALSLVERRLELCSALVLADTKAAPDAEEAKAGRTASAQKAIREGAGPIADGMAQKLFAAATHKERAALVADVRAKMAAVAPAAVAAALLAMRDRADRRPHLAQVRVPTLVIVGAEDAITPPAEAESMKAAIPGASLVKIEGAGHLSNVERPAEFNAALLRFLDASLTR